MALFRKRRRRRYSDRHRNRRRAGPLRWLLRIVVVVLLWLLAVAGYITWVGQRDNARASDAIVVLGAAAYDARPSPVFTERIRHGIDLYRRGLAPKLVFTGGFGPGSRFAESEVAKRYALRNGVPAQDILIETLSRDTHDNLAQALVVMRSHGLHDAIVVSDPMHMARALRLCRELGLPAVGSATPTTRFRSHATQLRFLLREVYFFHRDLVLG